MRNVLSKITVVAVSCAMVSGLITLARKQFFSCVAPSEWFPARQIVARHSAVSCRNAVFPMIFFESLLENLTLFYFQTPPVNKREQGRVGIRLQPPHELLQKFGTKAVGKAEQQSYSLPLQACMRSNFLQLKQKSLIVKVISVRNLPRRNSNRLRCLLYHTHRSNA